MSDNNGSLLRIEDLKTHFFTADGVVRAVDGVSFEIAPGQTLGLVGESGCGKSVTAFSVLRLLPSRLARIVDGTIWFRRRNGDCIDLVSLDPYADEIRSIRGNEIAMIFQEPMTSLSPVHTIGDQISEAIALHQGLTTEEAMERAVEMLAEVGMSLPEQRVRQFPHQLSGGMRQRAMIAMALSCNPALLIADEPTTALDVTIQAQILDLMRQLQSRHNAAILMITHNLGVVAEMADHVAVMYMGRVVESGTVRHIFKNPQHPYTVGLLQSVPKLGSSLRVRLVPIPGTVPDPFSVPVGCPFRPRCKATKRPECSEEEGIPVVTTEPGHEVRCTLYM